MVDWLDRGEGNRRPRDVLGYLASEFDGEGDADEEITGVLVVVLGERGPLRFRSFGEVTLRDVGYASVLLAHDSAELALKPPEDGRG